MRNDLLKKNLILLEKQKFWLLRSYSECKELSGRGDYTPEEFDSLEILCGRFSRSIDFLVRKFFRTLDDTEFETQGTIIDVINNAHKRGIITDIDEIKTIRDIRNEIVHEYIDDDMINIFDDVISLTPAILEMIDRTLAYSNKLVRELG